MNDTPLLTRAQAAAYLSTTERHLQDLWDRRDITAIKVGRLVRWHKDDLDRYIDKNRKRGKDA